MNAHTHEAADTAKPDTAKLNTNSDVRDTAVRNTDVHKTAASKTTGSKTPEFMATASKPAGFRRRYAAFSLDFAGLALLATAFTWSRVHAGWLLVQGGTLKLTDNIGQALADGMMTGTPPAQLAAAVQHDPAIMAVAGTLQSDLWRMCWPWLLAYALLAALLHIGGECSRWQASPGKHALGMRVVDRDGEGIGILRAGLRYLASALSWLTLNLGHLLAAVPPQKRALHDYIAGTRVVIDVEAPPLPTWARAWLWLQVATIVLVTGWVMYRYFVALQASLGIG